MARKLSDKPPRKSRKRLTPEQKINISIAARKRVAREKKS